MFFIRNEAKDKIKESYENFTEVEKSIAKYFLENNKKGDFSSKAISNLLFVSEASLSRFSKKCGFKGYREFIYLYESGIAKSLELSNDEEKVIEAFYDGYMLAMQRVFNDLNIKDIIKAIDIVFNAKKCLVVETSCDKSRCNQLVLQFLKNKKECHVVQTRYILSYEESWSDSNTVAIVIIKGNILDETIEILNKMYKKGIKVIYFVNNDFKPKKELLSTIEIDINEGIKSQPNFSLDLIISLFIECFKIYKD